MTRADYAVIYTDGRGTYQVQLFCAEDIPLAHLNERAEKFNKNKYSRKATVITDPVVVSALCFFRGEQDDLRRRMKNFEHALNKLEDEVRLSSFVKLAVRDDDQKKLVGGCE